MRLLAGFCRLDACFSPCNRLHSPAKKLITIRKIRGLTLLHLMGSSEAGNDGITRGYTSA